MPVTFSATRIRLIINVVYEKTLFIHVLLSYHSYVHPKGFKKFKAFGEWLMKYKKGEHDNYALLRSNYVL